MGLINFSVRLEIVPEKNFELKFSSTQNPVNYTTETRISPTEMALYQFVLPEDEFCSILSIQPRLRCPEIHDQERDMRSGTGTQFQTFLGTAALVIERSRYPDGIHVVLLVQEKDKGCYRKTECPHSQDRERAMDITIEVQKLEASKMEATIAILVFYFVIAVMAASLSHVSFRYMLFEFEGKFGTLRKRTL